jgi:hypothetical protein
MEYTKLSAEAQRNLLEGRLEQLESQHFNNEVNLAASAAVQKALAGNVQGKETINASTRARDEYASFCMTKVKLEAEITSINAQIKSLPAVEAEEAN